MISNDLLNRLVAAAGPDVGNEDRQVIPGIFRQLIAADTTDALLQDYSIQRGVIWASADSGAVTTARAAVIDAVLLRLDGKRPARTASRPERTPTASTRSLSPQQVAAVTA